MVFNKYRYIIIPSSFITYRMVLVGGRVEINILAVILHAVLTLYVVNTMWKRGVMEQGTR